MDYKVEDKGNIKVVHLTGEIDMDVADKARQTILPLIEAGNEVHLNLSKVDIWILLEYLFLLKVKNYQNKKKQNLN